MNSEKITQIVLGGFMAVAVLAIGWFFIKSQTSTSETKTVELNQISLNSAATQLTSGSELQAYYIGCRNCPHCLNLEATLKSFLAKNSERNQDNNLIYKVEAGYNCVPSESSDERADYEKIYQFLVDNGVAEENESKGFGTPHFYLVKDGKIVDSLDKYGRTEDGLTKLFSTNSYRGF